MCLQYIILGIRIPVPNNGACDWGLKQANITASCDSCAQYYDPRPERGNNKDGFCVYVPEKEYCIPQNSRVKKITRLMTAVCIIKYRNERGILVAKYN